jgi:uncharacterized membrane protein (DUF373 family)
MVRDANRDPGHLAAGMVGDVFVGMFLLPVVLTVVFLGLFFVLGYTHLLGGPFGFFRFLFVVSIIGGFLFFFILYKLYRVIKNTTKHSVNSSIKVESKIVE